MKSPTAKVIPPRRRQNPSLEERFAYALTHDLYDIQMTGKVGELMRNPLERIDEVYKIYCQGRELCLELVQIEDIVRKLKTPPNGTQSTPWWYDYLRDCRSLHGYLLATLIAFNEFLSKSHLAHDRLEEDRVMFCAVSVCVAEECKVELPLTIQEVTYTVIAAWAVTDDPPQKKILRQLLEDYRHTLAMRVFVAASPQWEIMPAKFSREIDWIPARTSAPHKYQGKRKVQNLELEEGSSGEGRATTGPSQDDMHEKCCVM